MSGCGLNLTSTLIFLQEELDDILKEYVGRPNPLYHAIRLSESYKKCV